MTNLTSIDHTTMREMNLVLVLNTLRQNAPISRAEIARMTGLRKATVSSLVKDLVTGGFVQDIGVDPTSTQIGRPSSYLKLNPEAGNIIGAEIGVDFISVIATNFAAEIITRKHESTLDLNTQEEIIDRTIEILKEIYKETSQGDQPVFGIGLGVPGLVDESTGTLLFAPNLGWRDVPLRKIFEAEFNVPVYVDNEANLAALGETYFGAGQDSRLVLYIVSGTGLGGGIVINGQLLTGSGGFTGEVGHMTIDPAGLLCNCGNHGCWETVASQRSVFRRVREGITKGKKSSLMDTIDGDLNKLTIPLVVEAAASGDPVACQALEETGYWLGLGIANLMNALNPQRVVIGGTLSLAKECLMPAIRDVVNQRALPWVAETAEIIIAEHGADACVIGGIATVYQKILSQPTGWL
ncbi:MAG: ROK family transcriptional regulator [Anaerolineales bacterium]